MTLGARAPYALSGLGPQMPPCNVYAHEPITSFHCHVHASREPLQQMQVSQLLWGPDLALFPVISMYH